MSSYKKNALPKGITYRENDGRYMGRFMYHGESFTTYGKTIKETQKKMETLRYEVEHGIYFKNGNATFGSWFEIWLRDYKEPSVKMGTITVYRQNYNAYIKKTFEKRQLRDIRTDQIQRFYNEMAKDYSHNTLEICRAILNGAFMQAVRNEVIQRNPVSNAVLPRNGKKKEVRVMTIEEQTLFLEYAHNTEYFPLYELALSTGMRSGEIRGLQWSDVNFNDKAIHVSSTLTYQNGAYYMGTPKTTSSDRIIPMLNNVIRLLKQRKKEQAKERLMMGSYWNPLEGFENLVFTNSAGRPINRDRFKIAIDDIVKEICKDGIDFKRITPHTFRHTFATRCIENNVTPKVLQTILGHNDLATTMDTYVHVLKDTKETEMQKLACLFS
ncbi:site-specific integrase [Lacrimispora amygdalina]|uniref:Site-specific integrase n=1 Tax=Lacrimispora amygdalina TaxID=253257 RepID=A0A3E2N3Z9_9FIRM|nr:site-specific integrase [Clostridium indicum]RFZ75730.1 site-specific integrase [Clostridium indicum]